MQNDSLWKVVLDVFLELVSMVSNLFTIGASAIAIYVFLAKREEIKSIFNLLINYTYHLSLSELKEKIEILNEYNAKDVDQCENIVNIFNDITGQIKGNDKLKIHFAELLDKIEYTLSDKRRLTEPRKRSLVSELRERLRNLNVENIDKLIGG